MNDITEPIRRVATAVLNSEVQSSDKNSERVRLESLYGVGNVWDTGELQRDFSVQGFMAPFCVVTQKSTGKKGAVTFQHDPRFYFNFIPA
jgi:hypothetical protein